MQGIKILGIGSYVPETVISNDDFTGVIETNDEWITTRTGIKERHYAMGTPTWKCGANAALKAVENSGISKEEIDMIICTTVTPDSLFPSTACMIQRELGITGCMAFDASCACAGFVYAVDMAHKYLATGSARNVLVVSAENLSKIVNYEDRASCILFGDGAAAVVLCAADTSYSSFIGADGNGADFLRADVISNKLNPFYKIKNIEEPEKQSEYAGFLAQDGKEVYKFAVGILPFAVNKALEKSDFNVEDLDMVIPHQANIRIIQTAASKLGLPMDKFYVNIERYGNTSSASIPLALSEAVENGSVKRGDKIALVGFGAGLTYGAVCFEY
ncbi:MAG: ketoacyl-ACP synthase III [Oscillospiraceae bacterium]|nr:ketoacyl-ACP synthase III [Oscillospiraceae bacterium]